MGHKRPKKKTRVERDQMLQRQKKERRKSKWERQRKKWSNDEEYQKKQQERLDNLQTKKGYTGNIARGERLKRLHQERKKKMREIRLKQKKLPNWARH